ncbi:MAG TPA: GPW/gp25 family protein [Gemmatimonadales bacterium]|nr:GPW/gp25 family protein [Gemmatimonadales bacterium]
MSNPLGAHLAFPFRVGPDGRTVPAATTAEHVRGELIQLLLTALGERPFIPELGCGLRAMVFEPASEVVESLTRARITEGITRWLGHRLVLEQLEVEFRDETIEVTVKYRINGETDSRVVRFQRTGR